MSAPDQGLFSPLVTLRETFTVAERACEVGDVDIEIRALQRLIAAAGVELDRLGAALRRSGMTYADIGDLFGMTKQGAQYRFGKL